MARYLGTVTSPRSLEDVYAYMADFSNAREWDPSVVRASVLDGTPGEVGCRFEIEVKTPGGSNVLVYETKQAERPNRIVLFARTGTISSEDVISLKPLGEGTELTYDADLRLRGPLRLADPLLGIFFRRLAGNAADGLRRELGD